MDEARAVLERLDRVERLERDGAPRGVVLEELRRLVADAEAWARAEPSAGPDAEGAVERLKAALDVAGSGERTLLA